MLWLLILLLWPQSAEAHAQWFVTEPIEFAYFSAFELLIATVGFVLFMGLLLIVQRWDNRLPRFHLPMAAQKWLPLIAGLAGVIMGGFAYLPELLLVYLGLIAYALLSRWYPRMALTALAMGVGLAFVQGGFAEKLIYPEYSATFLQTHPWNFVQALGITWFTDRWFILQAGVVEVALGIGLAIGLAPRFCILSLLAVSTLTAIILGAEEVIGHSSIVIAFIIYLLDTTKGSAWTIWDLRKRTL